MRRLQYPVGEESIPVQCTKGKEEERPSFVIRILFKRGEGEKAGEQMRIGIGQKRTMGRVEG